MDSGNTSFEDSAVTLSSPIDKKIARAEASYGEAGARLLKESSIVELLETLGAAIQASRREMVKTGIAHLCRECEQDEGGSCCGAGLENRYDVWLLLINLLMDASLPAERRDPTSCFFLGDSGCLLKARHVICVNYVCKKITDRIDPRKLHSLREKEGAELNALFLLHERVKGVLKTMI